MPPASLGHQVLVGGDAVRVVTESNTFTYTDPTTGRAIAATAVYDKINILDPTKSAEKTVMPLLSVLARHHLASYRLGAYAQDLITLSPKFKVLAGLRWSYQVTQPTSAFNQSTQAPPPAWIASTTRRFRPRARLFISPCPPCRSTAATPTTSP